MSDTNGLNLQHTKPPIVDIVDDFERVYKDNPVVYVTQVHQNIDPGSLVDFKKRFDWSDLRIYDINVEGMKQGILLDVNRWAP